MKKAIFTLTSIIIFLIPTFSQESSIKNYPLRDYLAPEIKYREFDLGTWFHSDGGKNFTDINYNNVNLNAILNYYEYKNTSKHQGITDASFYTYFSSQGSRQDSIKDRKNRLSISLNYASQNRVYYGDNFFLGAHGYLSYNVQPINSQSGEHNNKDFQQRLNFTPYISVGKGRIQPVESARRAMDILLSLQKNHRLALNPDDSMIDSLAKVANRIRFKRFYDRRYKDIYQLEELDRAIQDLGLVDSLDIVYFANLNDIWNFAPSFNRGSGTRIEGGIIPDISYRYSKREDTDISKEYSNNFQQYAIYGFFSFNRMRPISYAWQSDLMIDLTMGYSKYSDKSDWDGNNSEVTDERFSSLLNASWQFGFYPNTRTFAGITPFVGVSNVQNFSTDENEFGVNTGLRFESYYYISPKLRLTVSAGVAYYDNFASDVPTPFWNTVSYSTTNIYTYQMLNELSSFPIDAISYGGKKLAYDVLVSLTYAIF